MQKTEFESVIYPLIVTETKDFESVSDLGNEELINIAVWELVINGKKSVFEDQETGDILFPQDQMTYIVEKLFGEDMKLDHSDSGIGDIIISYNKKKKQYIILKMHGISGEEMQKSMRVQMPDIQKLHAQVHLAFVWQVTPFMAVKSLKSHISVMIKGQFCQRISAGAII